MFFVINIKVHTRYDRASIAEVLVCVPRRISLDCWFDFPTDGVVVFTVWKAHIWMNE